MPVLLGVYAMTPVEMTSIVGAVAGMCGMLIGAGIRFGMDRHTLKTQGESHQSLKSEFVKHKDDKEIHIDPKRDDKLETIFRDGIHASLNDIKSQLVTLNMRCENRGAECVGHFGSLERKLAAATGKANGEKT